ncbi:MAG: hypothetical protein QXO22_07620, partial [Thermosphaera sp.]
RYSIGRWAECNQLGDARRSTWVQASTAADQSKTPTHKPPGKTAMREAYTLQGVQAPPKRVLTNYRVMG